MLASDRTVYGRSFKVTPLWVWLIQRASGVLLGPLVLLHMWSSDMASSRMLNAVLLAVILAHGYSGLRRLAVMRNKFVGIVALTWIWCAIVAFFGALIVVSAT